jgi:hypothetical protein
LGAAVSPGNDENPISPRFLRIFLGLRCLNYPTTQLGIIDFLIDAGLLAAAS